ncbi:hypothetical protein D3C87_2056530 [compost metagenome]
MDLGHYVVVLVEEQNLLVDVVGDFAHHVEVVWQHPLVSVTSAVPDGLVVLV